MEHGERILKRRKQQDTFHYKINMPPLYKFMQEEFNQEMIVKSGQGVLWCAKFGFGIMNKFPTSWVLSNLQGRIRILGKCLKPGKARLRLIQVRKGNCRRQIHRCFQDWIVQVFWVVSNYALGYLYICNRIKTSWSESLDVFL